MPWANFSRNTCCTPVPVLPAPRRSQTPSPCDSIALGSPACHASPGCPATSVRRFALCDPDVRPCCWTDVLRTVRHGDWIGSGFDRPGGLVRAVMESKAASKRISIRVPQAGGPAVLAIDNRFESNRPRARWREGELTWTTIIHHTNRGWPAHRTDGPRPGSPRLRRRCAGRTCSHLPGVFWFG